MGLLFILTSSLFFLWVLRDILFWLWLWQHNDYRADRFFADIQKKKPRITGFSPLLILIKILLFLLFMYTIFNDSVLNYYHYLITGLYILQTVFIGKEIYKNRLKKPRLNVRAVIIIILTTATLILFFVLQLMDPFFWLLLTDLLLPIILALFVLVLSFPTEVWGDWQTDLALKKLRKNPDLLIIGVTGSYGKSLVKDTIAQVLSIKYKVIKTHGADNTLVGISSTILKHLESDTEVFVAEMSAYKRGEIAALCRYIHPKIGVLTGINNQYRTLFKTQENINKTNFELVESLPKKGFCIFNGNDKHTAQLYKQSKKQKIIYTTELSKHFVPIPDIKAFHITHKAKRTSFNVRLRDTSYINLAIPSTLAIDCVLPAIYIAYHLGMTEHEIKKGLSQIK
jgi:UDP-N-acetylmuramoyl-tripeptide--D-alanyl-D-alanine ligase